MMPWRRLAPLLLGVAVAMAGIGLGAQLQNENALPPDWESQAASNRRAAAGDVIILTGLLVAGGAALCAWSLRHPRAASVGRSVAAVAGGVYILDNLLQTAWPFYVSLPSEAIRQATLNTNLLASNHAALPSALVPVFSLWVAGALLAFWGVRRLLHPAARHALATRLSGTTLLAAPGLLLAGFGCLRLMTALPAVPEAVAYRVLLALTAMGYLGLLVAAVAKRWQLRRAAHDPRLAPLSLDAWEGIGRAEAGIAALVVLAAVAGAVLPKIPPTGSGGDAAVEGVSELLKTGSFGTQLLHIHILLLLLALLPLLPLVAVHREGRRALDPDGPPASRTLEAPGTRGPAPLLHDPAPRDAIWWEAGALAVAAAGAAVGTWALVGALWGWVAAAVPALVASARAASGVREAQATLLAALAAWGIGNSLAAQYSPATSGLVRFGTDPTTLELWKLAGAILLGWCAWRLVRRASGSARARVAIPAAALAATAAIVVCLLELPLSIWTNPINDVGTVRRVSVFVGTAVARLDGSARIAVHLFCTLLAMGAAVATARLLRPEWFRRGPAPAPAPAAKPARA
jgi:hypothetical protein